MRLLIYAATLSLAITEIAQAQFLPPTAPAPIPPPAPLMYVRFTGPKEAKITVYRGFDKGQTLELPVTLGFRPGYSYRIAVFDIPNYPAKVFCPSFEVLGTLALAPKLRNADFPAHVNFTDFEFEKVMAGAFVKKIITLERPDLAIPIQSKADEPLEIPVPPTRELMIEAAERGLPLVVFQMGEKFMTPQELNARAIPGTVLLPGDRILGAPPIGPSLRWYWYPLYDPLHGPRHPSEFVTIYDGGDSRNPAGFDRFGRLKGLDATDTIAEYTDSRGNRKFAASNRVALCVPRFIVFKTELALAAQASRAGIDNHTTLATPAASVGQAAIKQQAKLQQIESIDSRVRLSGTFNTLGTSVAGTIQGLRVKSNLRGPEAVSAVAVGPKPVEPEDGPLLIIKWPDKACVNVGEIVTFFLKYSNTGGQAITNVVVSDSLAARFEYVKGSVKSDRDAVFTTEANEVGSTTLRWEFTGSLPRGEHGLITFQVRVR